MRTQKRRRKARARIRKLKAIGFRLFILLLIGLVSTGTLLILGIDRLRPGFSEGEIAFFWKDETLHIEWPEVTEDFRCQISIYDHEQESYRLLDEVENNEYTLDQIKEGSPIRLKLQTVGLKETLFGKTREVKGEKRELDIVPVSVNAPLIKETADIENQTVTLEWNTYDTEYYEIYILSENNNWNFHAKSKEGWFLIDFINNYTLPDRKNPLKVAVRACYPQNDGIFYSDFSETAVIERKELMPEFVDVHWEKTANSMYRIYWEESIGDLYEVQQWNYPDAVWEKIAVVEWDSPLVYEIGRIPSSRNSRYRVITYYEDTEEEKKLEIAEPGIVNFWSDLSPLYCTIWPIQDLEMYSDSVGSEVIHKIPAGTALCVLGEENEYFQIMYEDQTGYIRSDYCLINLPEYLGDLCKYHITNSYSSVFRVHEYDIPHMTDEIIPGYEHIKLENEEYIVPFLYPCSHKLRQAAENCIADGYTLVIYDAFRPNEATKAMFDTAFLTLDYPVPEIIIPDPENDVSETADDQNTQDVSVETVPEETSVSENSLMMPDRYDGMVPEAISNLLKMTPEEWTLIGLTPETVAAVADCSAESVVYLKNMSYDTLTLIRAGVFEFENEMLLYSQQMLSSMQDTESEFPEDTLKEDSILPVIRIDTSLMGIYVDVKGAGLDLLPLKDFLIWQNLPEDQILAFKRYLENSVQTFYHVMTDDRYRLGSFLAEGTSTHNRGIALDLTIENTESGEEMSMQTAIHDLSWYSALPYNNENADLLAGYMLDAGFHDLSSEWWHFQDDDTRNTLSLNAVLSEGLSIEGWKKNDIGWYYQLPDGTYYKDITVQINGTEYTFDKEGYCER